ncbi:MAG TPA: 3'-5' exonuclease [Bacteroidia bacterium]|jgi:predicted PolB exonuclease-like 3'-5' exonuclease|nr:3'-5' exonuclease [Bacteroidia bacterium]
MEQINTHNILFLDIETAPLVYKYADLKEPFKKLWDLKYQYNKETTPEQQYSKAGIFAEFAKVICICVGYFNGKEFRMRSFYGDDEKTILKDFKQMLDKHFIEPTQRLCAHNGKEFDFPFLCRRFLINEINLPEILDLQGKKPWEIQHLDTMELWKFGDYKNYTSLNLLAAVFNIPTPKDDIDGSQVSKVYYEEKNIERIKTYCQKDVVTVARLYQKMKAEQALRDEQIVQTN